MPWQRMIFRNDAVWIRVDDAGRPVLDRDGRAEMKYRETDTKTYRPGPANLSPAPEGADVRPWEASARPRRVPRARTTAERPAAESTPDTDARGGVPIMVWTDGACSGNPGP